MIKLFVEKYFLFVYLEIEEVVGERLYLFVEKVLMLYKDEIAVYLIL